MTRRILLSLGCCAALAVAAPGTASAKTCSTPDYPGSGYFTSLSVKNTTCAKGRAVALAHYRCRTETGRKGRCSRRVKGFRCTEKRQSIPSQFDSRVTCIDGGKRVVFTYQQNT